MEQPRFEYQTQLHNLQDKLQKLRNATPEEVDYRNNTQEYYIAMRAHQNKINITQNQITKLQIKEIPRTPSQNAAHLDIRNKGFGLN